jgi:hypothetical protein
MAARFNLLRQQPSAADVARVNASLFSPAETRYHVSGPLVTERLTGARRNVLDEDYDLPQAAFQTLSDGQWLSSAVIYAVAVYLNELELATVAAPRTLMLPVDLVDTAPLRIRPHLRHPRVQYLCTVVNTQPVGEGDGAHWVCYHARFDHYVRAYTVGIYDSLGGGVMHRHAAVCERLALIFTTRERPEPYGRVGDVQTVHGPLQADGHSCGVCALAAACHWFEDPHAEFGLHAPFSSNDLLRFRYIIAAMLGRRRVAATPGGEAAA